MTINRKDLKRITEDYHSRYFPDWKVIDFDMLARESGPILQAIVLDRSSDDIYRPTGCLQVLTAPRGGRGGMELPQRLKRPNGSSGRYVRLQSHEKKRDETVEALRQQIVPSIERPLVVSEVLELYEREAIPTAPEAFSLATLRAYLGYNQEARKWCAKFKELQEQRREHWSEITHQQLDLITSLEQWLDEGTARQHLEEVLQEERRKLGLVP